VSLTREQILQADDLKREKVPVPEWSGDIYVRELTGIEALEFDAWMAENKDNKKALGLGWHPLMVMLCACDESGERLFSRDDFDSLKGKNKEVIARIAEKAISLNRMGADDIEDEVKNSQSKHSSVSAIA
jgi:hypothetical protein